MIQRNPKKYKIILEPGLKPTVPDPNTLIPMNKGWKSTDILIGQWAYNVPDKKWYTRDSFGIVESTDERFKSVGDALSEVYNYINGQSGGLPSYFELVNAGLPNEYLRLKKPLAVDYEIQAWSSTGWLPPTIWESLPLASDVSKGAIMYNPSQFEFNANSQLTIKGGVLTPSEHTHSWDDIISGVPTEFNPSPHGLTSDRHTVSGLTAGHFLKSITATSFGFSALTRDEVAGVLVDWFEYVPNSGNPYIRFKYPIGCDYEIQAFTNSGQLPSTIWESLPLATTTAVGGIKLNSTQFEFNADSQLTIKDAVITPKVHTHYQLYQPSGTNPFVYTDNSGQLHIDGNIVQNGSVYETHAEQVYTKDNTIILRDGATVGLSIGEYAGLMAKLYDGVNDGQLVYDKDGIARVGDAGSLQPLTTRTESPTNGYFAYWESSSTRLNFKQLGKSDLPSSVVYNDQANTFGDYAQSFKDNVIRIYNPANTYYYTLTAGAIVANRVINLPVLVATDTIVTENHTQTLTNKTISANNNTVLAEWFEIVNAGQTNEYLRVKKPIGCDYEIQAFTNNGQMPSTIWESLPIASTSSFGVVKIGTGISVNAGVISVATGAGMVYPASGIPVSTGTAWGTSIQNNSTQWNAAYTYSQVGHLPLAGGTMSNTNLVNNLNADLLDGYHAQTSLTDTNDRLMRVGAFGLGGLIIISNDWDSIVTSGFYRNSSTSAIGIPTANGWIVQHYQIATTNAVQIAQRTNTNDFRYRIKDTTWGSWVTLYHSANSNLSTVDWAAKNLLVYGYASIGGELDSTVALKLYQGTKVYGIYESETFTNRSYSIGLHMFRGQISDTTGTYNEFGARFYQHPVVAASITNSGYVKGNYIELLRNYVSSYDDSGTLTGIYGMQILYGHYNTTTTATPLTTNAYGLLINPYSKTGTITNAYDIYLSAESTGGTVTNAWGIYQANTRNNYLTGKLGLGVTPAEKLHANGNIRADGKIISKGGRYELQDSSGNLKWSIRLNSSTSEIEFYNSAGTKKAWIDQDGNLIATGELTAYST